MIRMFALYLHINFITSFQYILDEFDKSSGTTRTCEQSVAVNKCEGQCASSLRPSALNANGFSKVNHSIRCIFSDERNKNL